MYVPNKGYSFDSNFLHFRQLEGSGSEAESSSPHIERLDDVLACAKLGEMVEGLRLGMGCHDTT